VAVERAPIALRVGLAAPLYFNPHELFYKQEVKMKIREDLKPGNIFPNFERPDQDGVIRTLDELMRGWPTIVVFWRGQY
jgi:hypothetical protein